MSEELLLPDGLSFQAALEKISGPLDGFDVEPADGRARETKRTLYDTFDGRLRSGGGCAVFEGGYLRLGALEVGAARPPERVLAASLEAGPLRDVLEPLIDVRALLPLAQIGMRERRLRVLDGERKTVVRATLEEPAVIGPRVIPLAPRLRLDAVRGYDASLKRVRGLLEREFGLRPASTPLVEEVVSLAGGAPEGVASKIDVPLSYDEPADVAAAAVLRALFDVVEANLEGTLTDLDSEFLHDFRVSVRRSRSVQRQLKAVFPRQELAHFRAEFRWLQEITGEARDLDVYLLGFDSLRAMVDEGLREELAPLLEVLTDDRRRARAKMVKQLHTKRFQNLQREWAMFLERLPSLPAGDRPGAQRPIGPLTGERISKVYRQMVKMGGAIDAASPPEDYHELRKKGKELRYLLQLLGVKLYPEEIVKPMVKALKGLQDLLGHHQDREVQMATVRSLSEEVSARPGGSGALIAMGALLGALAEDERVARAEFAERFAAFSSNKQRALVKETFA